MTLLTTFVEEFQTALDVAITTNISEKEKVEKKDKQKKEHVKDILSKTLKHVSTTLVSLIFLGSKFIQFEKYSSIYVCKLVFTLNIYFQSLNQQQNEQQLVLNKN